MTPTAITPFTFEDAEVRVIDRDGEPWFVLNDVCFVLEIANPWNAAARLDDDEKGVHSMDTPGGTQEKAIINESGLHALLLTDPRATTAGSTPYRFRKWVMGEIVPAVRTGAKATPKAVESVDVIFASGDDTVTMSSREIAEVCKKRHDHVVRDIEKMLSDLELDAPKFGGIYLDAYKREKREYLLPKDLTLTLVTGYRADLRFKIIKRVEELEAERREAERREAEKRKAEQPAALPDFTNPAVAARAWADEVEAKTAALARVAQDAPKVSFHDQFVNADGLYGLRNAARALGQPPQKWIDSLKRRYIFYEGGQLVAYAEHERRGLFVNRVTMVDDKARQRVYVTPKGLEFFAQSIGKDKAA